MSPVNILLKTTSPIPLGGLPPRLHKNDPWVVAFQSCSKNSIPCTILVAMATNGKLQKLLVKNCSEFKIIRYKCSLGDPIPRFKYFDWLKNMAARDVAVFIPRHTLVSGYYVIPFGVCPSVRPSVLTISDR